MRKRMVKRDEQFSRHLLRSVIREVQNTDSVDLDDVAYMMYAWLTDYTSRRGAGAECAYLSEWRSVMGVEVPTKFVRESTPTEAI